MLLIDKSFHHNMKTSLKKERIEDILKKGKRFEKGGIVLITKGISSTNKISQCAVVVAKKYIKKSTERNRIKRYIREKIRQEKRGLNECVILFRKKTFDKKTVDSVVEDLLKNKVN